MNIFGSCTCPSCELETRFLLETGQNEHFYLLGDVLETDEPIQGITECDYCQGQFALYVVTVQHMISDFLNEKEYTSYLNGTYQVEKAVPKAGLTQEYTQELKQFHESFHTPFEHQPFEFGHVIHVGTHAWKVEKVYKKEGIETDITKRLITPTLDEYWYEVTSEVGEKKWCIVTDTAYDRYFLEETEETKTLQTALKEAEHVGDWYELNLLETESETEDEAYEEHNAILTIEAPFLKENERKYEVTDSLFQTAFLFEKALTHNLYIKAYQYISGVRFFVLNKEGELELDLFGNSAEELLDLVQEQLSISTDEN